MKPFLPYDKQLERMVERGLTYSDRERALTALKGIGYYRLSAYTYPFRQEPNEEDRQKGRQRNERFVDGATLEHALSLYEFDEKLRTILLRGLQLVEVGIAVKVGYVLGKRAPDAHLHKEHLDETACAIAGRDGGSAFVEWTERYVQLRKAALQEEYVKHHVMHYGGEMPIWVATGFMDFGAVVRLYGLMEKKDRQTIARELGLQRDSADTLGRWLKALNILRNHCAHNNRVWNRSTVDVPPRFSEAVAPPAIHHLNQLDNSSRQKLYLLAALTAYLVNQIDPRSVWGWSTFKTHAKSFSPVMGITLQNTLGFPAEWQDLELWSR